MEFSFTRNNFFYRSIIINKLEIALVCFTEQKKKLSNNIHAANIDFRSNERFCEWLAAAELEWWATE